MSNKNCYAKVNTVNKNEIIEKYLSQNYHLAKNLNRNIHRNSVKRKAQSNQLEFKGNLYTAQTVDTLSFYLFSFVKENIWLINRRTVKYVNRVRRSSFPVLWKTLKDVHDALNTIEVTTLQDNNFLLLHNCDNCELPFSPISVMLFLRLNLVTTNHFRYFATLRSWNI